MRMYVNAFWFGFLIAMVVILILTLILAYVKGREEEKEWEEYQPTEEEVREALEEITGKKFRVVEKNGYLVGEEIEDEEKSDGKDENAQ